MKELLSSEWFLRGVRPHMVPTKAMQQWQNRHYVTDLIPATVPGGVHYDLFRAGVIENPYFGMNSLACEWVENRWWIYETTVKFDPLRGKERRLVFEGLDYECDIYIDDVVVASHANMFTRKVIDLSHVEKDSFDLLIYFKGVPRELGQWGATSMTHTQKSRFGYGWDFATHLVNIGIWRPVYLEYIEDVEILDTYISTDLEDGVGLVRVRASLKGETEQKILLTLRSPDGELVEERQLNFTNEVDELFEVKSPALWYPNGMGAHPLYTVELRAGAESYQCKSGIRRLRYLQTEGAPEDALPYAVELNGERVYLRGNNKTPFDHLYGNVDKKTYEWYVRTLVNENVNLVRVWGGGIIETEEFYDLCDEYGLLVWQDFIQSSSGYEHTPSKLPLFLQKLGETAEQAVKERRNHVCLTYWCGGNELADENNIPVTYQDKNIALLRKIANREDPMRLFLPTTSSGPTFVARYDVPNHDAHGPWYYFYDSHYKNNNGMQIMLHAEFGVGGPAANTHLFLNENVGDSATYNENCHHDEFWWHSYRRDKEIFGVFPSTNDYTPYGQWIMAESNRYIIENERRRAPKTCGSSIWVLNEPWPSADGASLVSYFGIPKMSYYWAKKAFSDSAVSCKYDGICSAKSLAFEVCRHGDALPTDEEVSIAVYGAADGKSLYEKILPLSALPHKVDLPFTPACELYMIRVTHRGIEKDYFISSRKDTPYLPARSISPASLSWEISNLKADGDITECVAAVKNTASVPAYFVNARDKNAAYAILAEDAFFTLLPNEQRTVKLTLRPRLGLFFDAPATAPDIEFALLNS